MLGRDWTRPPARRGTSRGARRRWFVRARCRVPRELVRPRRTRRGRPGRSRWRVAREWRARTGGRGARIGRRVSTVALARLRQHHRDDSRDESAHHAPDEAAGRASADPTPAGACSGTDDPGTDEPGPGESDAVKPVAERVVRCRGRGDRRSAPRQRAPGRRNRRARTDGQRGRIRPPRASRRCARVPPGVGPAASRGALPVADRPGRSHGARRDRGGARDRRPRDRLRRCTRHTRASRPPRAPRRMTGTGRGVARDPDRWRCSHPE
jgi:hypothetical protein